MSISGNLKAAIADSGLSNRSLGFQAGVNRLSIARFVSGETSLSLEQAEKLAAFFGLDLLPTNQAVRKREE